MKHSSANYPRRIALLLLVGACVVPRLVCSQNRQATQFLSGDSSGKRTLTNTLPPKLARAADFTAQIQVQAHCSRWLVSRTNVSRTFVADPRIAEIAQFRPDELALIGLESGHTTATIWFENSAEPHTYLIAIVPPPIEIKPGEGHQSSCVEEPGGAIVDVFRTGPERGSVPFRRPQNVDNPGGAQFTVRPVKSLADGRPTALGLPRPRYDGHTRWLEADRTAPRGNFRAGFEANR
jgi:hypothetical protein